MLISDQQLLSYQRCQRRAFLDAYGDSHQQDPPSDFLLKLIQDSAAFQRSVLEEQIYHQPQYAKGNWAAGAKATLDLMRQGVDRICRGVLLLSDVTLLKSEAGLSVHFSDSNPATPSNSISVADAAPNAQILANFTLLSRPDILIKQPGQSLLGDWRYVPGDIRLGKRPKLDYQMTLALHAQILAAFQGIISNEAWLILKKKGLYVVNLQQRMSQMLEILTACAAMLQTRQEPEVFIARQKCSLCWWYSSCHTFAQSEKHLSLLPGVTPSRYALLQALNITTVESLASTNPNDLVLYPEFAEGGAASQVVQQAQSTLENRASFRHQFLIIRPKQPIKVIPSPPIELYFDIEAEPELNLDYLLGILVVDKQKNTDQFHNLLAENPQEEALIWQEFLKVVWTYPIAPIYHFCDYEIQAVRRLAKLYHTPDPLWKPVLKRFVDIHKQVTQKVILPVESYALKPIARWMGFEWRDPQANGAQCVCWYQQWLKAGNRASLDAISHYNEDDCRATYHVKMWLSDFGLSL